MSQPAVQNINNIPSTNQGVFETHGEKKRNQKMLIKALLVDNVIRKPLLIFN